MDNLEKCQRCGGEVQHFQKGSSQGIVCKNCNWSLVTTYIQKIKTDTTVYSIYVVEADLKDTKQIKAISRVSGKNYLDARKLLQQDRNLIYEGEAIKILEAVKILDSAGVKFSIMPKFTY